MAKDSCGFRQTIPKTNVAKATSRSGKGGKACYCMLTPKATVVHDVRRYRAERMAMAMNIVRLRSVTRGDYCKVMPKAMVAREAWSKRA
jgi:hypothetical protein